MINLSAKQIHPKYRPDIDGLRALAIILVLAYHAFPELVRGGFIGVDIFFVISGYLISTIIYENLENNNFSFANFYIRRIRRIFPALIFVLISTAIFGWFSLLPNEYKDFGRHLTGGAGFISNLLLWEESGYFDKASNLKPLLHLWSLGIEEQFYIVWPLVLFLSWKLGINLLSITLGLLVASLFLSVWGMDQDAIASFYSPQTRFWELLIGAILAYLVTARSEFISNLGRSTKNFSALSGLALIVFGLVFIKSGASFPGWQALIPTAGALLLLLAGEDAHLNKKVFSNKFLIWLGCISFPLYLWHWPVLSFMWIINQGEPSVFVRIIGVLLSVALADFTYRFVERPLRFGSNSKIKVFLMVASMLIVGVSGIAIYKNSGFPHRSLFAEFLKNQELSVDDVSSHNKENCSSSEKYSFAKLNKDFFCMESVAGKASATSAIVGDSHAYPMYFGFYDYFLKQKNEKIVLLGAPGCPPFLDVESYELGQKDLCKNLMNAILARVANDPSFKTVVLVNRAPLYITGFGVGEVDTHNRVFKRASAKEPESSAEAYKLALESTAKYLAKHGKNIIFTLPPPELGFNPSSCIGGRPFSWRGESFSTCRIAYRDYLERTAQTKKIVFDAIGSDNRIGFLDPADVLCDLHNCYAYKGGRFMYSDNNHLSPSGAKLVVDSAKDLQTKLYEK